VSVDGTVKQKVDLSRVLLASVARDNLATLQQGLMKQTRYWSCVARIAASLSQHMEGFRDIDLGDITEKLATFVSLPDAGFADQYESSRKHQTGFAAEIRSVREGEGERSSDPESDALSTAPGPTEPAINAYSEFGEC